MNRPQVKISYEERVYIRRVLRKAIGRCWLVYRRERRPDGRWHKVVRPGPRAMEAKRTIDLLIAVDPPGLQIDLERISRLHRGAQERGYI